MFHKKPKANLLVCFHVRTRYGKSRFLHACLYLISKFGMTPLRRRSLHCVILSEWRVLQSIGMSHPTHCTVYTAGNLSANSGSRLCCTLQIANYLVRRYSLLWGGGKHRTCTSCSYLLPHILCSLSTTNNAMGSAHIKYSLFFCCCCKITCTCRTKMYRAGVF